MALESAIFIGGLVSTNPTAADSKSQGDDHLRLIKATLQASFPTSSKSWYNPTAEAKVADFTVAPTDMNKTFYVTNLVVATATLPLALGASDAGWECHFIKIDAAGSPAFWIAPTVGTLTSGPLTTLAKTRRVVPGVRITAYWTGVAWYVSRSVSAPIGTVLYIGGLAIPAGYEPALGATLSGTAGSIYPDYYAAAGTLLLPTFGSGYVVVVE